MLIVLECPGIGYFKVNDDMSFAGPIDKFLTEDERDDLIDIGDLKPGDVIFFIADRSKAYQYASLIRDELGKKLSLIDENEFSFCIIKDIPMYEWNEEEEKYNFMHNPFSMPKGGIKSFEIENIEDIIAYQFDFVCNGIELASGAVRNYDLEIMKKAFSVVGVN